MNSCFHSCFADRFSFTAGATGDAKPPSCTVQLENVQLKNVQPIALPFCRRVPFLRCGRPHKEKLHGTFRTQGKGDPPTCRESWLLERAADVCLEEGETREGPKNQKWDFAVAIYTAQSSCTAGN